MPKHLAWSAMTLALLGLVNDAEAFWLSDEWRSFRTYPRMEKAYLQVEKGNYAAARELLEEVHEIDPSQREAILVLADLCSRQKDAACIDKLARDWQRRGTKDGVSLMLLTLKAYVEHDARGMATLAPQALQRPGLSDEHRGKLAWAWITGLLQLGKVEEAGLAIEYVQQQKIFLSPELLQQVQFAADHLDIKPQPSTNKVAIAKEAKPAATVVTKAGAPVHAEPAAKIVPVAAPVFPYRELNRVERDARIEADIYRLVEQRDFQTLQLRLRQLHQANLYSVAIEESIANALQGKNCPLLLQQIAVSDKPAQTSARSQMAAAYCSPDQPVRSAQHFAAASSLRRQQGLSPTIAALRGEGAAWLAAGQPELAMQRWDELLQRQDDFEQGAQLAQLALQYPDLATSKEIARRYPYYFPAGQLALRQAEQASEQGDFVAAEAAYRQSLAEAPDARVWHEYAGLLRQQNQHVELGNALQQATALEPDSAQLQAEYGFWLKDDQQSAAALTHFSAAKQLEAERSELLPEMAMLEMGLGQTPQSVAHFRQSIDEQADIQARTGTTDRDAQIQLYGWQQAVQSQEDRWGWYLSTQIRLNDGPDAALATSPVQYGQYNGTIDTGTSYRLDPLWDVAHPTWVYFQVRNALQDRSVELVQDSLTSVVGIRQRLLKDYVVMASAEWLYRQDARYENDLMLRLSGSHSVGTGWQPMDDRWTSFSVYGEAAWLAKAQSYYLTTQAELGEQWRLSWLDGKATLMPYISTIGTMNTDNDSHASVSRVDIGIGVALQIWHGADMWRAPDIHQRLSLEARRAIGGNSEDNHAFLFRWSIEH